MKIITINLPETYLDGIKTLSDLGIYASRSEAIRAALRDFLSNELMFFEELEHDNFKRITMDTPKERGVNN